MTVAIDGFTPCSPEEAVQRMLELLTEPSNGTTGYLLGAGDYHPGELPWGPGPDGRGRGADCRIAVLHGYRLKAARDGYNRHAWASVADCINYNSLIEDAEHTEDLVSIADVPQPGDILAYPTVHIAGHPPFIGHGALVVDAARWDGSFHSLDIVQIKGPPDRMPAAVRTDGSVFDQHSLNWPKPEHRSRLLRINSVLV